MKYTINNFRLKVMDCIEGLIESEELGNFAYDAWFYFSEGDGKDLEKDKYFVDFLLDVSSEWGHISIQGLEHFEKGYLQNILARIEAYMNVDHQGEDSFI